MSDGGFEEFFTEVIGDAVSVATRILSDRALAEDAAVEAMARAHRWTTLSTEPCRRAWVLRVAINAALDAQRSERRRRDREERSQLASVAGVGFESQSLDRLVLVGALLKLPRRQREAISLRYLADLSERDAATAMGVSTASVKVHVRRGLSALGGPLASEMTGGVCDVDA